MNITEKIIYASVLSLLSLFVLVLVFLLFMFCRKKPIQSEETLFHDTKPVAKSYQLTDLDAVTDGFNHRLIIGSGRLGTVYVAVFPGDNHPVAVKRIHPSLVLSKPGFGFSSVVKTLSLSQHPNVVSILGFSEAPGERIVVTEFAGTASLDVYLHGGDAEVAAAFDWRKRIRVAAGAARGLEYLHEGINPNIIHGRIKSSNIIIDDELLARISDYGLGFLVPNENIGFCGYPDEEHIVRGGACKEADVYEFGVVLLEILSGRRSKNGTIVRWAIPLIKEHRFAEILDQRIVVASEIKPLVIRMSRVALACVGNSRESRPSISQVTSILNCLEREGGG